MIELKVGYEYWERTGNKKSTPSGVLFVTPMVESSNFLSEEISMILNLHL